MPLKGIPFILSPDLLHTLCSAGHGDEIVLADAHFPSSSICRSGPRELRADGHSIPPLLEAILKVFPLDIYVESPVKFEQVERFEFYERAKKAFAVVHTGETAQYGNIILKKGVVF
jgi:L-fucose mutarotase